MPNPRAQLPLTVPDVQCWDDVDALGRETTSDLETLEQDCYHILIEDLRSNPDDPDRGVGIYGLLSGNATLLTSVERTIEEQFLRDDRIDTCVATVTVQPATDAAGEPSYTISIQVGVDGTVIGLQYSYSQSGGLQVVSSPTGSSSS